MGARWLFGAAPARGMIGALGLCSEDGFGVVWRGVGEEEGEDGSVLDDARVEDREVEGVEMVEFVVVLGVGVLNILVVLWTGLLVG